MEGGEELLNQPVNLPVLVQHIFAIIRRVYVCVGDAKGQASKADGS